MHATMTEGAVANVVGECRSIVFLIEILHGMGTDRDRDEQPSTSSVALCCGVIAALQPFSVKMRLVSTSYKPKQGWTRMITRLRFGRR
jgi:hypothetical protein